MRNSLGFIFECKSDIRGEIGLKEKFTFSYKGDIQRVNALFGIDLNGNILSPVYMDKASGFTPVASLITRDFAADVEKFCRSNRAIYSLCSVIFLVCEVDLKISRSTHEWVPDGQKINFYMYKGARQEQGNCVSMFCDIVAPSGKLNTFKVNEGVINGYKQIVLSQLKNIITSDKKNYIAGRLSRVN